MFRYDIYASIAKDIAQRLMGAGTIDTDKYNEIKDAADRQQFTDIFDGITDSDLGKYALIAKYIGNNSEPDDNIDSGANFHVCDVETANAHLFKNIGVFDDLAKLVCVAADYLKNLPNPNDPVNPNPYGIRIIERIWTAIHSNSALKDSFWNLIENGGANKYVLVTDSLVANNDEGWRLYSFGYLLYCNSNSFARNSLLDFDAQSSFKSPISLIACVKYEQYFDIYDLIFESHYCDDILSRYLNMYHIIENICYRRHLARLSRGGVKRNAFVRKAIRLFAKGSEKENQEIVEGITELFPTLNTAIITGTDFTQANKNFILSEYGIEVGTTPSKEKIARIIYQLRNSIAHNKATELHFGFGNVLEYQNVIDLIQKFIERLEPAIIDLIGNNPSANPTDPHPLEYDDRSFDVY